MLAIRKYCNHPLWISLIFWIRWSKVRGRVLRVAFFSLVFSAFQLLSLTTVWYLPFSPLLYEGTKPYPSILKLTGRRRPLFSRFMGSLSLFLRNKYVSFPTFFAAYSLFV